MVGIDEDPSRAQIVLVGALAIAFIVLGIVVVFNTSLYAENVDSTGTVSSVNQAEQVRDAGGHSVAGLAYRMNEGNYTSESDLATTMNGNASNLSAVWQSLYARSQPTAVNVSLDESNSEYGVRVFQPTNNDFRAHDGGNLENWDVTPTGSSYADVGRFDLTLERDALETSPSDAFHIGARGGDGSGNEAWRVIWFVNDSDALDVYVGSGSGSAPTNWANETEATPTCNDITVGPTIEVDMVNGSVEGTSCTFEFTEDIDFVPGEDGYQVRFVNGGNAEGQYDVHLSNTAFEANSFGTRVGNPGDGPYYSYILWETAAIVQYDSPSASYTRTATDPVYNSTR